MNIFMVIRSRTGTPSAEPVRETAPNRDRRIVVAVQF